MKRPPQVLNAFNKAARRVMSNDSGEAIIEMAFSMPALCLALFGFINFALVMYQISNITFATHAAARYASVHSAATLSPATSATVTSYVTPYLPVYPSNTAAIAVTYPATSTNAVGGTVKVVLTLTYTIKLPFFTMNALKVSSTALAAITV